MENYRQMWMSLRNDLFMRIREYKQADNIAGLDDYALTELDAWEGIMQEIEGLERQLEENNQNKEDKSINDTNTGKSEAFDKILDINIDRDELLSEEYIKKVNDVIQEWISS